MRSRFNYCSLSLVISLGKTQTMTETMDEWTTEWISKHLYAYSLSLSIPKDESACLATAKHVMCILGSSRSSGYNGPAQSVLLDVLRRNSATNRRIGDIQWTLGLARLIRAIVVDLWQLDRASTSHVFCVMCLYIVPRSEHWKTWALILSHPNLNHMTRELLVQYPNLALEVGRAQLSRQHQIGSYSLNADMEFVRRMMLVADDDETKIGYVQDSLVMASFAPADAQRLYTARHERQFPDMMKDCPVDLETLLVIHMLLDAELGYGDVWQRFLHKYTTAQNEHPGCELIASLKARFALSVELSLSSSMLISMCKSDADWTPFLKGRDGFVSKVAAFRKRLLSILFECIHSKDVGGVVAVYL